MTTQPDRKTYLGGSDAGPILGLSPWRTPLEVWLQKTGQAGPTPPDPQKEKLFRRGRLMEPVVIDMLIEEYGVKVTKRSTKAAPNYYHDAEHDYLAAEVDFEWLVTPEMRAAFPDAIPEALLGTTQNGEVKTVHPWGANIYGDEGTDEIPVYYAAQAMHGLMVSGRQLCMFPVLVGSDNLLVYWIHRDEDTFKGMRSKLVHFWNHNVIGNVPPEPQDLPDIYRMFRRRPATKVEATEAVKGMIQTLRVLGNRRSMAEEAIEAVQYEIGLFLLGAEAMNNPEKKDKGRHVVTVGGVGELTIAYQEQKRIDNDALREKHPAVAEECSKTTTFYKFNLKRNAP
jgi:putative phage-type endonuclease